MTEQTFIPGYWMNETSGILRPAIIRYLNRQDLTPEQIAAIRAYLRQWMAADWQGPKVQALRFSVDYITTRDALDAWVQSAAEASIDPL